ncbi:hypothetical protein C7B76_04210 [filamentous cyanobacterium CCP2]|nr:hypothetical protein C7B76_04210 [filamentous cyanobacterium CCP2]
MRDRSFAQHGGQVGEQEEDPEAFAQMIHRKQKEIERLEAQLVSRLPKGRDLTGEEFLETLATATTTQCVEAA